VERNFILAKFPFRLYYTNQEVKMRTKTQRKKPALNKKTIADLNAKKMKNIPGGGNTETVPTGQEPTRCTCTPTGVPGCANCISI
jgi:hypothetical protein